MLRFEKRHSVRDLPRLSVDIDLTYLPVAPRPESLVDIDAAMKRIGKIKALIPDAQITEAKKENTVVKLLIRSQGVQIKIEVTQVLRGCAFEPEMMSVKPAVEEEFGFAEARIVSFADLYAGEIVAALDRQHPRDLFEALAMRYAKLSSSSRAEISSIMIGASTSELTA